MDEVYRSLRLDPEFLGNPCITSVVGHRFLRQRSSDSWHQWGGLLQSGFPRPCCRDSFGCPALFPIFPVETCESTSVNRTSLFLHFSFMSGYFFGIRQHTRDYASYISIYLYIYIHILVHYCTILYYHILSLLSNRPLALLSSILAC